MNDEEKGTGAELNGGQRTRNSSARTHGFELILVLQQLKQQGRRVDQATERGREREWEMGGDAVPL